MAVSTNFANFLLVPPLLILLLHLSTAASGADSDLVAELIALQSQSESGVIHFDNLRISRFLTSTNTPRPYSLLIFFDAAELHENPDLHLPELRSEFSILAASFIANNAANSSPSYGKLFFCYVELMGSKSTFDLFAISSLPNIRLLDPNVRNPKESEKIGQGDLAKMADLMADLMANFIESRTNLCVGPIIRPPFLKPYQLALLIVGFAITAPFIAKKVLSRQTLLHNRKIWLAGSMIVYFFSVSGLMNNVIQKIPMYWINRRENNKVMLFYQGRDMQLGAEGIAVASLYAIVGLLLALQVHVIVRVKNAKTQRVAMVIALCISFWAVRKVILLDNWKTGYRIHGFWPSSWD